MRKYNISKKEFLYLYANKKYSIASIAKKLNCSPRTIHRRLQEYGIKRRTPWQHKYKELDIRKIKELYNRGYSLNEIARIFNVSYTKIRSDMISQNFARRNSVDVSSNKPILNKTKNLCYILGVLHGDGYLYKNGSNYCISLESVDMDFINSFKSSLNNINLIVSGPYSRKRPEKHQIIHKIESRSKLFFEWFKSLDVLKLKDIIRNAKGDIDFLRAIYESEGSYFITKEGKETLTIASTNKKLVLLIHDIIKKYGFSPTFPKPQLLKSGKAYYKLYFNKQKEIKDLIKLIDPCIKQKVRRK